MKIKNISTKVKYIPLKTPFITALRKVTDIEFVRVEVVCESGEISFGEAPATMAITGENIEIILNSIDKVKSFLISKNIDEAISILHKQKIGSSSKAALDMAFVSLLAQKQNLPIYKYLNGENTKLFTDITISLNQKDKMLFDSGQAIKNNMPILKVKLGNDINHAIDVTKALVDKFPQAKLLIDANQAWSLDASLEYIESLKDVKIELIEQPVLAQDLESLKIITQKSNIKIMADESTFTIDDVKNVMQSKSADMINIKLMKCGGLSKAVKILEYARQNSIKCMLGSMLEGPISINVALHLALAYTDVIKYVDLDSPLLYKEPSGELDFIYDGYEIKLDSKSSLE